ncbi:hypothetical protein NQ314_014897 [Rhamnusium bicolor]|uniref:Uncharacterized protein n=1 Tax=Rhamnusium bicolor TaxID=1586634 RepID=A0AAV8X0L2_9CUCU|nr:hypothetical protein NQ314_014897 [Rhamnusium bicolor]
MNSQYNLKIMGLMTIDSGLFQCFASNDAGNIQAAANLKVISNPGLYFFITKSKNWDVYEIENIFIIILIIGKVGVLTPGVNQYLCIHT